MLVSWNWLKKYVSLDMTLAELEDRLSMSGLNHEGTRPVGDDLPIDQGESGDEGEGRLDLSGRPVGDCKMIPSVASAPASTFRDVE